MPDQVRHDTDNIMESIDIPNPIENISKEDKKYIEGGLSVVLVVICALAIFAVPLIFVPFLTDFFDMPKQLLIFFFGFVGLLIWAARNILAGSPREAGKFSWTRSILDLPILLLAIVAVISAVLTPNYYSSLTGETLVLVGGAALFFLFSNTPHKENTIEKFALFMAISAGLIALLLIAQEAFVLLGSTLKLPLNLFFLNPGFNVAGSALAAGLFLAGVLPIAVGLKKKTTLPLAILIALGIICSILILYQNRPVLLDHLTGWKIATGVLGDSPKSALLGIGPGNIIDAFTLYKPLDFNAGDFWNLRFSTSSNLYLSILTSLGIFGLALLLLYVVKFIKIARTRIQLDSTTALEKGMLGSIALILLLGLLFPTPTISLFLLFVVSGTLMAFYRLKGISLYSKSVEPEKGRYFGYALCLVLLAALLGGGYFLGRFALADYFFAQSLQAAAQNNGKSTYDLQIKALELNPYNPNYRISYSQTNLALANSLAGQPDLTDEQKQTVVTLVQQAIREGRLAAALSPRRAGAFENLSLIYRNLINFAQGADQWAVASQQQAVQLDPNNPRLRLDLGGIFFTARDFQNAAQIFNQAVNLKADFANAHYNLAQALISLKINDQALQQLQLTATLVCNPPAGGQNADCQKVNAEIDSLSKEINTSAEASPSAQIKPTTEVQSPLATPGATPQTDLPKAKTQPPAQVGTQSGEIQP